MRSSLEIVCAIKDSQPVTEEEARLACVVFSAMQGQAERELRELVDLVLSFAQEGRIRLKAEFCRRAMESRFASRKLPPKQYLGEEHTPGTPANAALRKMAFKVVKDATGVDLQE